MYRPQFIIIILALAVFTGLSSCQKPHDSIIFDPLIHDWPHDVSDIPSDPAIIYGKLDNGLRYALRHNAKPKNEAVVRFWVRAGARNETDETLGVAHYLEHMAFNGSENIAEGEMVKSLERLGLSFGADTNASTTFTRTEYRLNLPELNAETVDYALFLMREIADKLLINEEAVERERGVVKAEEAQGNRPNRKARRAYMDFIYPDNLSRARPVIGTVETLDALTAEQIRRFYEAHYRPERSFLVMVGDFDVAEMEAKIRSIFKDWGDETPAPPDPDNGFVSKRMPEARIYQDDELTTQMVLFDAAPSSYQGDSEAKRQQDFIRSYANNIVNQRIGKKLLEADAPVRRAAISYSSQKRGDQIHAQFSAKNDDWAAGLGFLDMEIRQALNYGFQQAEYDELLLNQRRRLMDYVNYAPKRRSGSLASDIIAGFASGSVQTLPQNTLDRFEKFAAMVTVEDLERAFKMMWKDFDPLIWLEGPDMGVRDGADVTPETVLTTYHKVRTRDIIPPKARETQSFAYQNFGTPGKVVWQDRIEDFDITQVRFANNVRLNMKVTDFEDNWVRISLTLGEGWNIFPSDKPGLTSLAAGLSLGGYEAHKASDLAQIFAGKTVSFDMNIGSERLIFSAQTNPDDVEDQFKAWAGLVTAPGYRREWVEKFRENIEAGFHTIDSTPEGVASRDLGRIWANGDRRYGLLSKADYMVYTLEDVRAVLQPLFDHGAIEIGVVGDFEPEKIIEIVGKTFAALPPRRAEFNLNKEAFKVTFPEADRVQLTHTGEENQGAIYMAWPLPESSQPWTIETSRHYTMLQRILKNRMVQIIREDQGLAYSPSVGLNYSELSAPYGYISASILSDPKNFAAFETATKNIVTDLRTGTMSQDELDRALQPVLESFERYDKENGHWLAIVTRAQTDPDGLIYRRSRYAAYAAINPKMLQETARTLFDPNRLHVVTIKPEGLKP